MKKTTLSIPELVLFGATRGLLGAGLALLLADRLARAQRRPLALALLGIGALSTIPLALEVLGRDRRRSSEAS
jgi:hypothetical protein